MLTRRLCSALKKQYTKYLSTVSLPKIENELPVETERPKQIDVLGVPDYFKVHNLFTTKDLFDAKVHYGHKIALLHENMKPFIFGSRLGHTIFDLDTTAFHLREALNFIAHIAYRDGIILFVSKNPRMTLLVEKTALSCKEFAVTREWILGLFTDSEKMFKTFIRLPDLVIMLNTLEENGYQHLAVVECAKMCIPTVGIVDSNCSPNLITYPVPGNDDSYSSIQLYCDLFKKAILRGKECRRRHIAAMKHAENVVDTKEQEKRQEGNVDTETVDKSVNLNEKINSAKPKVEDKVYKC